MLRFCHGNGEVGEEIRKFREAHWFGGVVVGWFGNVRKGKEIA
jgi:hypothetical protein